MYALETGRQLGELRRIFVQQVRSAMASQSVVLVCHSQPDIVPSKLDLHVRSAKGPNRPDWMWLVRSKLKHQAGCTCQSLAAILAGMSILYCACDGLAFNHTDGAELVRRWQRMVSGAH